MVSVTGILDLSQIPQDQFDPKFELRVAVVRNTTVLGSATLSPTASARKSCLRWRSNHPFWCPLVCPARLSCWLDPMSATRSCRAWRRCVMKSICGLRLSLRSPEAAASTSAGFKCRRRCTGAGWSSAGPTRYTGGPSATSGNMMRQPGAGASAMLRCRAPESRSTMSIVFCGGAGER